MKKICYMIITIASLAIAGCGDGVELPGVNVETDLSKIPLPESEQNLIEIESKATTEPLLHVGGLHTEADFERIREKLAADASPWKEGYELLKNSTYAQLTFQTYPVETIVRGGGVGENYMNAARGAAAAYQLGLRWKIEQDDRYAQRGIEILNQWADVCTGLGGDTNISLASGIYGHEFALAGELLRDYAGWDSKDRSDFVNWMLNVFYPANKDFLVRHHDTPNEHYWANWPLCNIASTMAIGILADRRDLYNEAIEHFQTGLTNGRLTHAIFHVFPGEYSNFAMWQESGRDQGHTLMCVGLVGVICQIAWNQGDDFFKYKNSLFLKGCELAAAFNYTDDYVPFEPYTSYKKDAWGGVAETQHTEFGLSGRGNARPIWALPYYHYKDAENIKEEQLKYTRQAVEMHSAEGGGGNYGETSGGFDVLGFGTLMYAK